MLTYCLLHYKNIEVTIDCVESIIHNNSDYSEEYKIIIYDNGSNNGTGEILDKKYASNMNVIVISNIQNLGFARGNNMAYQYAKNTLRSDVIVVMNSDIIVDSSFSVNSIVNEMRMTNADILAPNIKNIEGYYQNPLSEKRYTIFDSIESIVKNHILITILKIPIIGSYYYTKYNDKKKRKLLRKHSQPIEMREDIIPHGACLVYGNNWIKTENIAFIPITFLYGEEEILYEYAINKNYKIVFDPKINVIHLGKATLKEEYKDGSKVVRFFLTNQNKSLYKLLKIKLFGLKNQCLK